MTRYRLGLLTPYSTEYCFERIISYMLFVYLCICILAYFCPVLALLLLFLVDKLK